MKTYFNINKIDANKKYNVIIGTRNSGMCYACKQGYVTMCNKKYKGVTNGKRTTR